MMSLLTNRRCFLKRLAVPFYQSFLENCKEGRRFWKEVRWPSG